MKCFICKYYKSYDYGAFDGQGTYRFKMVIKEMENKQ